MRQFGLQVVDQLPSSTHIVHFYQHGKDLLEVFAQFCGAGLEDGDCCLWVTTPPWTAALALHELEKRLPAVKEYVATGQLQLFPGDEWYLRETVWDIERTLAKAAARLQDVRNQGWSHVRVCGIPPRVDSEDEWRTCLQYEQAIHRIATEMEILALCAYRLGGIHEWAMNGLRQVHHGALSRHHEDWRFRPTASD
jgi:MEDS: MEthanogen/methylotroph, DcmR Sensory domain